MNAMRGKNSIQVYNDEDSNAQATNEPGAAAKFVHVRKPLQDVYQLFDVKLPVSKPVVRLALAEIVPCTNTTEPILNSKAIYSKPNPDCQIPCKQVLAKPQNKFFKHKWVPNFQIPNTEVEKDVDVLETVVKATTIWSPLTDDLESSGVESPINVDQSLSPQARDIEPKANYSCIDSPEIYLVQEFSFEIYSHLLNLEVKLRAKPQYMSRQPDITSNMRTIVVDWLVEVCEEYKLETETLYLTVAYLDRFLSSMSVVRSKLQLVGTAALFIASKYEEIYPPDLKEFVYITDDTYTKRQVLRMEHLILDVLGFDMAVPTAYSFLERLIAFFYTKSTINEPKRTASLAKYLCELTLLDGNKFLCFLPSQIACAAFSLAKYTMGQEPWNEVLEEISGYEENSFVECVFSLHEMFSQATEMKQQAIRVKYKSPKYHCVSLMTPPPFVKFNMN